MDKKQLLTILITALLSVTFKELITWLLGLLKQFSLGQKLKTHLPKLINRTTITLVFASVAIFSTTSVIYKFAYSTAPLGRGEIINLVFYWCVLLFWLRMFVITLADSVRRWLEQKEQKRLAKLRAAEQYLSEAKERHRQVEELKAKSDKLIERSREVLEANREKTALLSSESIDTVD